MAETSGHTSNNACILSSRCQKTRLYRLSSRDNPDNCLYMPCYIAFSGTCATVKNHDKTLQAGRFAVASFIIGHSSILETDFVSELSWLKRSDKPLVMHGIATKPSRGKSGHPRASSRRVPSSNNSSACSPLLHLIRARGTCRLEGQAGQVKERILGMEIFENRRLCHKHSPDGGSLWE